MRRSLMLILLLLPAAIALFALSDATQAVQGGIRPAFGEYEFYFTRGQYSGYSRRGRGGGWGTWAIDYPEADRHFVIGLKRMTNVDAYDWENPVRLDDPDLNLYPVLYLLEVGGMSMTEAEVEGLRRYLDAGGFLVIDDFWGTWEWANFQREMERLLPEHTIVDLPLDHPIFHVYFDVEEIIQVPNVTQGRRGGPTWEQDGFVPHCMGIFDERGRLMVVINWNTDLGDAWEWADDPRYPYKFSTYAWQMGINFVLYGMSH